MSFHKVVRSSDREAWLVERRNSIGASECPQILGLVSYGSATSVQADKWGLLAELDGEQLKWGNRFELPILEAFGEETGWGVESYGWLIRDDERPWLHATPDGLHDNGIFVQAKWTAYKGDDWDEGVPKSVQAQQQAEMAVTGAHNTYVAVLAGHKLKWATVPRDQAWIEEWLETAEHFWAMTQSRTPIVEEGGDATQAALKAMFPTGNGDVRVVGAEWCDVADMFENAQAVSKKADEAVKTLKAKVKAEIGESDGIVLPDGRTFSITRSTVKEHVRKESTRAVLKLKGPK